MVGHTSQIRHCIPLKPTNILLQGAALLLGSFAAPSEAEEESGCEKTISALAMRAMGHARWATCTARPAGVINFGDPMRLGTPGPQSTDKIGTLSGD